MLIASSRGLFCPHQGLYLARIVRLAALLHQAPHLPPEDCQASGHHRDRQGGASLRLELRQPVGSTNGTRALITMEDFDYTNIFYFFGAGGLDGGPKGKPVLDSLMLGPTKAIFR